MLHMKKKKHINSYQFQVPFKCIQMPCTTPYNIMRRRRKHRLGTLQDRRQRLRQLRRGAWSHGVPAELELEANLQ